MKKNNNTITFSEKELKHIISESVKNILSEIDWKQAHEIDNYGDFTSEYLNASFNDFKKAAYDLQETLIGRYYGSNTHMTDTQGHKMSWKITKLIEELQQYVDRKIKQSKSLNNHAEDKFNKVFGKSQDEVDKDLFKMRDKHGERTMEDPEWRKQNMTPDENDYYENYW